MRWEYLCERVNGPRGVVQPFELAEHLNARGRDGWELTAVVPRSELCNGDFEGVSLIFRRPVSE